MMEGVKLITGDCVETMMRLEPASVDMLFTDLPYGTTNCKWDTPIDLHNFWAAASRVVKPSGAKVLFAQSPFDKVLAVSNLKEFRYEWIWEKTEATGHLNAKRMPMKAHENILVFYDRLPTYNPQITHGHKRKVSTAMQQMVLTYTDAGQTVLDCCMGSGSIGEACRNTERRYIGIDNDAHWVEVAAARLGSIL